MKDAKKYYIVIGLLVICLIISVIMNFTQTAKLKNGKEVAVKVGKSKITANDLYSDLKSKYAMNVLIDEIDHMLLDSKYKTDEDETKTIDNQIEQIRSYAGEGDDNFIAIIVNGIQSMVNKLLVLWK